MSKRALSLAIVVFILTQEIVQPAAAKDWPNWKAEPVAHEIKPARSDMPESLSADDYISIQALMRKAQYQFTWQVSAGRWAYRASNPALGLNLAFATDGLTAVRYDRAGEPLWDVGFSLVAYGERTFPASADKAGLVGRRERVEHHWGHGVIEWYVNDEDGIEHGLTLYAPPPDGDVVLTYHILGSLSPELDTAGQVLRLQDGDGQTALLYDQLAVYDTTRRQLPAHFELNGSQLVIRIDNAFAVYPLTVAPLIHNEAAILRASDAQSYDWFGGSVAISGDTVVVGADGEDGGAGNPISDAGAAYVFERNQGGADHWGEVVILRASDAQADDWFGISVAISGDTVVVGAPCEDGGAGDPISDAGAAYVFERNQGGADHWGEVAVLRASDAQSDDWFGDSLAISGDTVVVGADGEDGGVGDPFYNAGAAYVFERNQGGADNWGEAAILHASDAQLYDGFGGSVAISGDTAVVGADGEGGGAGDPFDSAGAAYIFGRDQGGADHWGEVVILRASDAQDWDYFGRSVAISSDTVVVGAHWEDGGVGDPFYNAGAAYVFERNQGGADNWGEVVILHASDAQTFDYFGGSVAISGDTVVVGADGEGGEAGDPFDGVGAAYVFEHNQGGADHWGEVAILHASDAQSYDWFGGSVAISGDTAVVGADGEAGGAGDPVDGAGAAYIYWLQLRRVYLPLVIRH